MHCQSILLQMTCQGFSIHMVRDKRVTELAARAVDDALLTAATLADEAGISYAAIASWRAGTRSPDPSTLKLLAGAMERHAEKLAKIAAKLRKYSDQ